MFMMSSMVPTAQASPTPPAPASAPAPAWPPPMLGRGGAADPVLSEVFAHYAEDHPQAAELAKELSGLGIGKVLEGLPVDPAEARRRAVSTMRAEEARIEISRCREASDIFADTMCEDGMLPDGSHASSPEQCAAIWRDGRDAQVTTQGSMAQTTQTEGSQWSQQLGGQVTLPGLNISTNGTHQTSSSTAGATGTNTSVATTRPAIKGYLQGCAEISGSPAARAGATR